MANVVITGGTKGIGKGYAKEFLKRGHNVVVAGRTQESIDMALADLAAAAAAGNAKIIGAVCDVSAIEQVQYLWDKAVEAFESIDIWINNAGIVRNGPTLLQLSTEEMVSLVESNVIGTMLASQVALQGMTKQGHGHIYNTLGSGNDGKIIPGMIVYGTTKHAISYFTKSLQNAVKDTGVKVSTISPGVNISDGMIREVERIPPETRAQVIRSVNIMGDYVETTTPWIVERILNNDKSGTHISWMNRWTFLGRHIKSFFQKRDLLKRYGLSG